MSTRTTIRSGSGSISETVDGLSMSHPFVDILLPADNVLLKTLETLETSYRHGRISLSNVLSCAYSLTDKYSVSSDILLISKGDINTEDVWCLDHRGLLTLSLTKETYQLLSLVGSAESRKNKERFIVHIDLYDRTSKTFTRAKEAFQQWDDRRKAQGVGCWDCLCHAGHEALKVQFETTPSVHRVKPQCTFLQDIHVPKFEEMHLLHPIADVDGDDVEDWHTNLGELFEWVALACMGSDRLKASDRVDPYISVYEPPSPNEIGKVAHISWRGLLTPAFTHSILNAAFSPNAGGQSPSFVSVTANMTPDSPVSYIQFVAFSEGVSQETRLRRSSKSVQCWSLLAKPQSPGDIAWALATMETTTG